MRATVKFFQQSNRFAVAFACVWLLVAPIGLAAQTVTTDVLDNGLELVTRRHSLTHAVELQLLVQAAPAQEDELLGSGVSELVRRLVSERFDNARVGGEFRSWLSTDVVGYAIRTTDEQFPAALGALLAALRLDAVSNDRMLAQRQAQLAAIAADRADPLAIERQAIHWAVYRQHPDRLPVHGRAAQLADLEPVTVRAYHKRRYTAANMTLIVVGNLGREWVREQVVTATADLPLGRWQDRPPLEEPTQWRERVITAGPVPSEREVLVWRTHAMATVNRALVRDLQQPDRHISHLAVLEVIAAYLAHPEVSPLVRAFADGRLATDLRIEHRLVPDHTGYFAIGFAPNTDQSPEAMLGLRRVLTDLAEQGPTEADLRVAKMALHRRQLRDQQTVSGQATSIGRWWRALGDPAYGEDFRQQQQLVTAADVQATASLWLRPDYRNRSRIVLHTATDTAVPSSIPKASIDPMPRLETDGETGLRLLLRPLSQYELVHIGVTLGGGSAIETDTEHGAVALLARLLPHGSTRLDGAQFQRRLARDGMQLEVSADIHGLHLGLTCFRDDVLAGIDLLVGLVKEPSLPAEQLPAAIRDTLADSFRRDEADWRQRLLGVVRQERLAGHYGARPPQGSRETLESLSRDRLLEVMQRLTVADNMVWSVYGDLPEQEAITAHLQESLAADPALAQGEALVAGGTPWPSDAGGSNVSLSWDGSAALALAWRGPPFDRLVDDGPALDVLSALLVGADGGRGRLDQALAKVPDLAQWHLEVVTEVYDQRGLWVLLVRLPDSADRALVQEQLLAELQKLDSAVTDAVAVPEEALDAARRSCATAHALSLEDQASTMRAHAMAYLRGYLTHWHSYDKRIQTGTARDDLRRVTDLYLQGAPLVVELSPAVSAEATAAVAPAEDDPAPDDGEEVQHE